MTGGGAVKRVALFFVPLCGGAPTAAAATTPHLQYMWLYLQAARKAPTTLAAQPAATVQRGRSAPVADTPGRMACRRKSHVHRSALGSQRWACGQPGGRGVVSSGRGAGWGGGRGAKRAAASKWSAEAASVWRAQVTGYVQRHGALHHCFCSPCSLSRRCLSCSQPARLEFQHSGP